MESRPLRYFVAVAEELNFTRAAARLGLAVPPLSRAIRRLESELGVPLFERSTRQVSLTPAGVTLLAEARPALDALRAAGRRAQRSAGATPALVLAMKADGDGGLLEPLLTGYRADPAALPVSVRLCAWGEQPGLLLAGEADAALIHGSFDRTGLDAEVLLEEPRVLATSAAASQLPPAVLSEVPAHDLVQLLTLIEIGQVGPAELPASVRDRYPRPGITYRDLPDAPPTTLSIVWPSASRNRATAALVRAAEALRG